MGKGRPACYLQAYIYVGYIGVDIYIWVRVGQPAICEHIYIWLRVSQPAICEHIYIWLRVGQPAICGDIYIWVRVGQPAICKHIYMWVILVSIYIFGIILLGSPGSCLVIPLYGHS